MNIIDNTTSLEALLEKANNLQNISSIEKGDFTITDNGLHEPGVYQYTLTSDNLKGTDRLFIAIIYNNFIPLFLYRDNINSNFEFYKGASDSNNLNFSASNFTSSIDYVTEDSLIVFGITSYTRGFSFIAF